MKKNTFLFLFFCALLFQSTWARTVKVINNLPYGEGSFTQVMKTALDGDTIAFDESLKNEVIDHTGEAPVGYPYKPGEQPLITVIGNGVTFKNMVIYFSYAKFKLENLKFVDCSVASQVSGGLEAERCSFFTSNFQRSNSPVNTVHRFTACSFSYSYLTSTGDDVSSFDFISCSFVGDKTFFQESYSSGEKITLNLTNCVLGSEGKNLIVNTKAVKSNGYNVLKGNVNVSVNWQSTDVLISDKDEYFVASTDGIVKPLAGGKAIGHLPANTTIAGVKFPKTDLLGNTIDYTQASHSGANQTTVSIPMTISSIELDQASFSNFVADSTQLNATIKPIEALNKKLTWTTSDASIATVSAEGLVKATASGTATITAQSADGSNVKAEAQAIVEAQVAVTGVKFTSKDITNLFVKGSEDVYYEVMPSEAYNKKVKLKSLDESIASTYFYNVSQTDFVVGIKEGTTKVVIETEDGAFTDTISVTVAPRPAGRVLTVTSKESSGAGTLRTIYKTVQTGDTICFDKSLANDTIKLTGRIPAPNYYVEGSSITMIGNGVTILVAGTATEFFAIRSSFTNLKFKDINFVNGLIKPSSIDLEFENCTFNNTTVTKEEPFSIYHELLGYTPGIDFVGSQLKNANLNYQDQAETKPAGNINFISSTIIVDDETKAVKGKVVDKTIPAITFTNSVIENTTASPNYFQFGTLASKGYNVIKDSGLSLTTLSTDARVTNVNEQILIEEKGIYNVAHNKKAFGKLPANTTVAGIVFPQTDINRNLIDYTTATHSGASQTVLSTIIPESITLDSDMYETYTEDSVKITVTVLPEDAMNKTVVWTSSKPEVATVTKDGWLKGLTQGSAKITATTEEGNLKAEAMVIVYATVPVTGISMENAKETVFLEDKLQLKATIKPAGARNKNIVWSIDNVGVASIDQKGLLTATSEQGEVKVYAKAEEGNFLDSCIVTVTIPDFTKGTFFVNEDWFGHADGSVNFMTADGKMFYDAYRKVNGEALGVTAQYGTIYGDKFYITSKQPSASGRLVVADAKTLKKEAMFPNIGGGDGRAFVGVNDSIGYIGSSKGINVFDIKRYELKEAIAGIDGGSDLYKGQIGSMIRTGDYVFAIMQNKGIIVIDANTHKVDTTLVGTFSTMTQSKDGYIWAATDTELVQIDPYSLEIVETIDLGNDRSIVPTWGAWTAGALCASTQNNVLYWAKQEGGLSSMAWFGTKIYRYVIGDKSSMEKPFFAINSGNPEEVFYGSCLRVDPVTDNLVITTTQKGGSYNYNYNWVTIVDNAGKQISHQELTSDNGSRYFWFPALAVFPDNQSPVVVDIPSASVKNDATLAISLDDLATDADNMAKAITKSVVGISNPELLTAVVKSDSLRINPIAGKTGTSTVTLRFNSNGKVVDKDVSVVIEAGSGIDSDFVKRVIYSNRNAIITDNCEGYAFSLYDMNGKKVFAFNVSENNATTYVDVPSGVYILQGTSLTGAKISVKLQLQ